MSKSIISFILSILAGLFAALGWDIDLPSIEIIVGTAVFRVLATKRTNAIGIYTDKPLT
jgi:hypothetical protein